MSDMPHDIPGVQPTIFVLPILLMSIAALVCLLFCALNIMGEDEFALRVDPTVLAAPGPSARPPASTAASGGSTHPTQPPRALSLSTREMRLVSSHRARAVGNGEPASGAGAHPANADPADVTPRR
jgi:hypothetical protein